MRRRCKERILGRDFSISGTLTRKSSSKISCFMRRSAKRSSRLCASASKVVGSSPFSISVVAMPCLAPILRTGSPVKLQRSRSFGNRARARAENLKSSAMPRAARAQRHAHGAFRRRLLRCPPQQFRPASFGDQDKAEFFRRASRALAPGGLLLLVDTMREEDEMRDDYLSVIAPGSKRIGPACRRPKKTRYATMSSTSDMPEPLSLSGGSRRARQASIASRATVKHVGTISCALRAPSRWRNRRSRTAPKSGAAREALDADRSSPKSTRRLVPFLVTAFYRRLSRPREYRLRRPDNE